MSTDERPYTPDDLRRALKEAKAGVYGSGSVPAVTWLGIAVPVLDALEARAEWAEKEADRWKDRTEKAEREREDLDDRWTAQWQKTCHEVDALEVENEALREELLDQWQANHFEHCSAEWPHPATREIPCHWPLPEVLDGEQEASDDR